MITVVIPVLNEEGNVRNLLDEIASVSVTTPVSEIIFVDDGSTDSTPFILRQLREKHKGLRIIHHSRRSGQSAALWTGVKAASNDIIVTMDGDGQNDPANIADLYNIYARLSQAGARVMVAGEREKRHDSFGRRLASRLANKIRSFLLNDNTRDTGCSLKMFRRMDYLALPYFDHMHRFLPALMQRDGVRVVHTPVSHRPRIQGVSKYNNWGRALVGVSDLLGVLWLKKRSRATPAIHEDFE